MGGGVIPTIGWSDAEVTSVWPAEVHAASRIALASNNPTFILWGPELRILYNQACVTLLGDKHPGAQGQRADLVLGEVWDQVRPCVQAALLGRASRAEHVRLQDHGGPHGYLASMSFTPMSDVGAGTRGVFCTIAEEGAAEFVVDMSRRKRLDEALTRSQYLVEHSRDILLLARQHDGRILQVNEAAVKAYGYSRQELLGLKMSELRAPDTLRMLPGLLDPPEQSGALVEAVHCRKDGSTFPVEVGASEETIGGIRVVAHVVRDLSERRDAHARLAKEHAALARLHEFSVRLVSHANLAELLQTTVDAAVAVAGAPSGLLQLFDPSSRSLKVVAHRGFEQPFLKQFSQVDVDLLACGDSPPNPERTVVEDVTQCPALAGTAELEAMTTAGVHAFQITPMVTRDGTLLGMIATYWHAPHRPDGFTLRMLDLLAREAADLLAHQQRAEELRETDRHKTEFLALISHELRNPLTPIRNSLFVLENAAPGSDQARRAKTTVDRQVCQLVHLVDDLLDTTRLSRNKVRLDRQRVDLREVILGTVEDHRSLFEANGIRLETRLKGPVHGLVDPARVSQMLGNLLVNASKFTGRGGSACVSLWSDAVEHRAVIRVADTGAGIAAEMLRKLFRPFTQADRTLDQSKGGLGLGLSVVKALAEMHGGEVSAESAGPGLGAEFMVRLPLADDGGCEDVSGQETRVRRARRVMLIEDNADAADSLREALEICGHQVAIACDGRAGIALARAFRPDVVLCDISLPDIDGYVVARALRDDCALSRTTLIALSGHALPEDRGMAAEAGFDHHIAKPPDIAALESLISTLP